MHYRQGQLLRKPTELAVTILLLAGLAAAPVHAELPVAHQVGSLPERNYVNFRVGASGATARSEMCLEAAPLRNWSLEACGNGGTWFHSDNSAAWMHLRGFYGLRGMRLGAMTLQPRLGLGVAELQIASDDAGMYFTGTGPRGVETAGPEATASLRLLAPVWRGFELLAHLDVTAAWLPHARELVLPRAPIQPNATLTLGFGF